jgi:hypothetical protein
MLQLHSMLHPTGLRHTHTGVLLKLRAIRAFLTKHPEYASQMVFIQCLCPMGLQARQRCLTMAAMSCAAGTLSCAHLRSPGLASATSNEPEHANTVIVVRHTADHSVRCGCDVIDRSIDRHGGSIIA